jgi:hypothetical protein
MDYVDFPQDDSALFDDEYGETIASAFARWLANSWSECDADAESVEAYLHFCKNDPTSSS